MAASPAVSKRCPGEPDDPSPNTRFVAALIGAIVGEFVAGEHGLGYVILTSQATFNSIRAFAAIVVFGVLGTIMFFMIEAVERWMLPWHVSQRSQKGR